LREHGPVGLAAAVKRTGGGQRWARDLGVPGPQPASWTEELIDRELRLLCAGKTYWPTKDDFRQAGLAGLLTAARRGRGCRWWAQRLGVAQRRRSPTKP
jgi:hypothetical protein